MRDEHESQMRGEGGAPADRYAIRYYQKIWAEGGLMGIPERVNGTGFVMACPGRSSDVIHMYVWIEAGTIQEARWQCHMCDPWMQVAGDILCHLVRGESTGHGVTAALGRFYGAVGWPQRLDSRTRRRRDVDHAQGGDRLSGARLFHEPSGRRGRHRTHTEIARFGAGGSYWATTITPAPGGGAA